MVEMAGVEPASRINPIVVIHKLRQFNYKLTNLGSHKTMLTSLLH